MVRLSVLSVLLLASFVFFMLFLLQCHCRYWVISISCVFYGISIHVIMRSASFVLLLLPIFCKHSCCSSMLRFEVAAALRSKCTDALLRQSHAFSGHTPGVVVHISSHPSTALDQGLGMFPLILTVLNRDYSTPYSNPYSGLLVEVPSKA